jgi:hypothetical protein
MVVEPDTVLLFPFDIPSKRKIDYHKKRFGSTEALFVF